jgi:hypothetical protein
VRKRAPVWRQPLDKRVEVHDRRQFELKLEYLPGPTARRARYAVDVYVCAPQSLNVAADTLTPNEVYQDIHNYVRFKTPELTWEELRARPDSPLVRAREELAGVAAGRDPRRFIYECKLYACVYRAALRDVAERCAAALPELEKVTALLEETLAGLASTRSAYRALRPRVDAEGVPERARAAYRLADEYTSLSVEQQLRRVMVALDRARVGAALKDRLLATILEEEGFRRERGWPSTIDPASDNEAYVYRVGLLKKYCSSALFLQVRRLAARRTWIEVLYAVAAGIAMAFALGVAFLAQQRWAAASFQVFVILVLGYMFKDRIKELARARFSRVLERRLFDRKVVILDPAGGELGTLQEKVEIMREQRLPDDVRAARAAHVDPSVREAESELEESVIHYRKQILLSGSALERRGVGHDAAGITDIMRFHVGRFLHDMDEPDQEIEYMDEGTRALRPIRAAKVYHVDVVFRFAARPDEPPATTLMRLVMDRNGIKRLETF